MVDDRRRCWLLSPVIKSWRRLDERVVLAVLTDLVGALSQGQPVALDIVSHLQGDELAKRLEGIETKRVRMTPSSSRLARLRRALGVHVATDALSVVAPITPSDIPRLLSGEVLWESEFFVYPAADSSEIQAGGNDPHHDPERLVAKAGWCLAQQDGSFAWLLASREYGGLEEYIARSQKVFADHECTVEVKRERPGVQAAVGRRVVRWSERERGSK